MTVLQDLLDQDASRSFLTRAQRRAVQEAKRALEHQKLYIEQIERHRELAAAAYAGLCLEFDLPERWVDVFQHAAFGMNFTTDGLLPVKKGEE